MEKPADTRHPVHDLIRRRWSPLAFAETPVEPEKLRSLLEAARWAASSYNEQPWAYLVATRDNPEEFEKLLGCLVEGNRTWARHVPVLMLSVAKLAFDRNGQPNRHAWHDVGAASATLCLQATALGLFVHQMAGILPAQARTVYGIPEGWEPVAGLAVGYPGDPAALPEKLRQRQDAPRSRKEITSFVFAGKWGQVASVTGG
jgi:nitroreductase